MRTIAITVVACAAAVAADAVTEIQSDWSGGPGPAAARSSWGSAFATASGVSWRAVPGQLALGSEPLQDPTEVTIDDDFAGAASVAVADIDGDGRLDVVGAAFEAGEIAWWDGDGGGGWTQETVASGLVEPISVHPVDLDHDGDLDVLGAMYREGRVAVWWNDGGEPISWRLQDIGTGYGRPHWVTAADLDGDGELDVAGATADGGEILLWRQGDGAPPTWHEQLVDGDFAGARAVAAADLDGDGDLDLAGVALAADQVAWWRNDGGDPIAWSRQIVADGFNGAHGLAVADLDDDDDQDLVAAGYTIGRILWWRNDGGDPVAWHEDTVELLFRGALTVAVADLDGDGDLDVAGAGDGADQVRWWAGSGDDQPGWERHIVAPAFVGAWPVAAADVDDDGAVDLVGGADESGRLAWWRLGGFVPSGSLASTVLDTLTGLERAHCEWHARTPPGATVVVELRSGDDPADLGPWLEAAPGPLPAALQRRRYLQYRVTLGTTDPAVSPILTELGCSWSGPADRTPRGPTGRAQP